MIKTQSNSAGPANGMQQLLIKALKSSIDNSSPAKKIHEPLNTTGLTTTERENMLYVITWLEVGENSTLTKRKRVAGKAKMPGVRIRPIASKAAPTLSISSPLHCGTAPAAIASHLIHGGASAAEIAATFTYTGAATADSDAALPGNGTAPAHGGAALLHNRIFQAGNDNAKIHNAGVPAGNKTARIHNGRILHAGGGIFTPRKFIKTPRAYTGMKTKRNVLEV